MNLLQQIFAPRHGVALIVFIVGALGIGALALFALMSVPPRYRKTIVVVVTFVAGYPFT